MKKLLLLISSILLIFSCAENDDFKAPVLEEFEQGYFIVNEGGFQKGNASLSFTKDFETITNDIFLTKNKEALEKNKEEFELNCSNFSPKLEIEQITNKKNLVKIFCNMYFSNNNLDQIMYYDFIDLIYTLFGNLSVTTSSLIE